MTVPKINSIWRVKPLSQGVAEGYVCPSCGNTMKWLFPKERHVCTECGYIDWRDTLAER